MTMPTWPSPEAPDPYAAPAQDAPHPAPAYGTPAYGTPGHDAPAYGTPAYGAPAYGTPAYGTPTYGAPAYGAPAYGAAGYGAPGYGGYGYAAPVWQQAAPPNDGLAIGAFVTSMSALVVGITAPVGAVLGIVSLRRIKRTGAGGKGFAVAAIAVGSVITVLGGLYVALLVALFTSPDFRAASEPETGSWEDTWAWDEGDTGVGGVGDPAAGYHPGDCLAIAVYGSLEDGEPVDCAMPHGAEVVGGLEWSPAAGEAYDFDALQGELWEHCAEIVYGLAEDEYDAGLVWADYALPSQAAWESGFARGTCLVASEGRVLTGSAYLGTLLVDQQGV